MFKILDKVKLTKDIWETDEFGPFGIIGKEGDIVIIKQINPSWKFPYEVAHEWITDDRTFIVADTEIEALTEI